MPKSTPDKQLCMLLRSRDGIIVDQALREIYQRFYSQAQRYIMGNSGSKEDAKDIYQDSIIVFYTNARKPDFKLTSSIAAYIMAILKNLWLKQLRQKKHERKWLHSAEMGMYNQNDQDIDLSKWLEATKNGLDQLKSDCQKVLLLFFFENANAEQVAQTMGYSSAQIARNKKFRCLRILKRLCAEEIAISKDIDNAREGSHE